MPEHASAQKCDYRFRLVHAVIDGTWLTGLTYPTLLCQVTILAQVSLPLITQPDKPWVFGQPVG